MTRLFVAAAVGSLLAGCSTMQNTTMDGPAVALPQATGYFAADSTLPLRAPDFSKISDGDFRPAYEQAMAIHDAEIQAIVNNRAAPTFENTIVALEQSGAMLGRVGRVFGTLTGANTNDTLDAIDAEISPKLTQHYDAISLNPALFQRVKAVYDGRAALNLDTEDAKLLEDTYEGMVHAGAQLTAAQKEQVKDINTRLSAATTTFGQRLTQATKDAALVITEEAKLAGLSDADIAAAKKAATERGAPGAQVITLQNTTQQPALATLTDRATREALFNASWNRAETGGENDTRALVAEIVQLRAQKAALFGAPDWATYQMYDRMAKNPKTALDFMQQMVPALEATQRRDAAALNAEIKASGQNFTVKPWDWAMYADKLKAKKYAIDEDAVKPYFELRRVLEDGVFFMSNRLYGLSFKQRTDLPVYNPDVWVYDVFEADGSQLGIFYFDPFQRDNKRGGAWMSNFVEQSKLNGTKPVIYNVLNIPKAPEGQPQLVSFDWVETTFHEFGHALHGFFANQKYESLSGTATARDFVEYPSQVHEMWASHPEVLANYAKHYQTGAPIPQELIAKMEAASKYDQGYQFGEVVEAALLDMKWHALTPAQAAAINTPAAVNTFENNALSELGLAVDLVPPRYRTSYFRHIFSDPAGYSAGYYSYLWTQMLDRDSRKWFMENGGLTRQNGDHFRRTVLSQGGTQDYFEMYRAFTGREPNVQPMLEALGLTGGTGSGTSTIPSSGDETG
ncbi:M3 family metallopeptidase [Parafrankia sp. BMG5.11]|uniref:M3 family metallopeptidase n=1 Tax=Parafrankia sp. BMG5.11 TaxID=222540 RepID=UPI001A9E577A|nr:M3 family metallopeptidase [Parafrankia sp. BMG5.11]